MITGGNVTMVNNVFARIMRRGGLGNGQQPNGNNDADLPRFGARVQRNLFGPIDHDEQRQFLDDQWSAITQDERERWNFDFVTETPLPGNLVWERTATTTATSTPAASSVASTADSRSAAVTFTREILARVEADVLVNAAAAIVQSQRQSAASETTQPIAGTASSLPAESPETEVGATSSQPSPTTEPRAIVQPKISDIFPLRKRKLSSPDKIDGASGQQTAPPPKRSKSIP